MKKKLLFVGLIVALLVVGVFGYAAYNANNLIQRYKPELERVASQALKSNVKLGNLSVSVFPSTNVVVDELLITRSSDAKNGLKLNNLSLTLELMPLLSGKLVISKLKLQQPSISLLKDASGVAIEGLPAGGKSTSEPSSSEFPEQQPEVDSSVSSPVDIDLKSFEISEGSVTFKDQVASKEYSLSELAVGLGVQLESGKVLVPKLAASGKLLAQEEFEIKGEKLEFFLEDGRLNVPNMSLIFLENIIKLQADINTKKMSGKAAVQSNGISLQSFDALSDVLPKAVRELSLQGLLKPNLDLTLESKDSFQFFGTIGLEGIAARQGDISVSDMAGTLSVSGTQKAQKLETEDLSLSLSGQPVSLKMIAGFADQILKVSKLQIDAFSGNISSPLEFKLGEQKIFRTETSLKGLNVSQALSVFSPSLAARIEGTLKDLDLNLSGALGDNLKQSLKGDLRLALIDGALKDVNLAAEVLKSVVDIPFISESLFAAAPAEQKAFLMRADTVIKTLSGDIRIQDSQLNARTLSLASDLFSLESKGVVGFDSNLNLASTIYFTEIFSGSLAQKNKGLDKLLDDQGRLVFPLVLKGIPPKVVVLPNLKKLLEVAAKGALKEKASEAIEQLIDKKSGGLGESVKGVGKILGF